MRRRKRLCGYSLQRHDIFNGNKETAAGQNRHFFSAFPLGVVLLCLRNGCRISGVFRDRRPDLYGPLLTLGGV